MSFTTRGIGNTWIIINILKFCLALILLTWIYVYITYDNFQTKQIILEDNIIEVEKWDNILSISKKLYINGTYLKYYISQNNEDFKLIAWKYKLKKWDNISNVLDSFKTPIIEDEINITILEWWNIYDIDEYLYNKQLIFSWDYINYVTNNWKIEKLMKFFPFLDINMISLEGFLYPDTYTVLSYDFKINVLVIKQLEWFENKVYNKILDWKKNDEIYRLINLASIVEKEEKNNKEKPIVAWILQKRLDAWWMIWADITVCYPYKLTSNWCKLNLSKYLKEKNKYNTRTMKWLPLTPIWNPSFESINSTLNFKKSFYWFYLHNTESWQIHYATDNKWHELNKKLYLK
jgi:UPF0755 protein